jgi:NitT/TauT family transport system substrate-binding protein
MLTRPRLAFRAALCSALLLLLVHAAGAQSTLTPVRVGLVPTDDVTPLVYAIRSGMFRQAGLDVQLIPGSSGAAMTAAVVSGSYEFGKSSLLSVLNAHLRNLPIAMVASEAVYDGQQPYAQLVVSNDSPLTSAKDMDGKTVGTPSLNDLDQLATMAWIGANGGNPASFHVIELPQSAAIAAVAGHRVDATVMHYPVLAEALATGKEKALAPVYSAISPRFVFAAYFSSTNYAKSHPDVVRKFVQTVYRAAAYTNGHHEATVQMMAEVTKAPASEIATMPRVDGATSLDPAQIQPLIDAAAKYRLIPKAFPARDLLQYAPDVR